MRLLRSRRGILAATISLLLGLAFLLVIVSQNFLWVGVLGMVISGFPIAYYYHRYPEFID